MVKIKRITLIIFLVILVAIITACDEAELYRELEYNELQDDIKKWVDDTKEKHKFGLYQLGEGSNISDYYFMFSIPEDEPLVVVKTIIIQGDELQIYLEDQELWLENGKDLCIIRIKPQKEVEKIVIIYNDEIVPFDVITSGPAN